MYSVLPRLALIAGLALGGCSMNGSMGDGSTAAKKPGAVAMLADKTGAPAGRVTFTQEAGGVKLIVEATGLTPGAHGLHIHTVGRCDAPDFTTAGPHWNPTHMVHGKDAPGGPHMGDLPNVMAGADGRGRIEAMVPGAMLSGGENPLLDADGGAVVIHATADDYKTDPSGNSGGRIICGVVGPA